LNNSPHVAIVILNWNGISHLKQFLPSVISSTYPDLEIVVADNGSKDGSREFLQKMHPDVRLICFDYNLGFANGYNEALKDIDADYYAILNTDVLVSPGWLEPMVELLEKDASYAACQPKLLDYKQPALFEYAGGAGGWLDRFGYPFTRGRIFNICEEDHGQYDSVEQVFWVTGAAMIIKSRIFRECGGFDPYFFAHQEEIDLCWRIQLAGYKLFACPSSTVYHIGGGTLPTGNSLKTYLNFRNNHIMIYKNMPWSRKWWTIPFRILLDAISAWKGLLSGSPGYFIAILRAHIAYAKWLLFHRGESVFPKDRAGKLAGFYNGNLVWQHFIKGKKYFSQVIK